jgi:RNA polymerase sigma-70 factor (ECF subfamily)
VLTKINTRDALLKPGESRGDHEKALRRFGAALVRDDRHVRDDRAAAALAEPLIRQTLLAFSNRDHALDARAGQRALLFAQFIQRYRRHARMIAADQEDNDWVYNPPAPRSGDLRAAVHRLPLELREAILLVVVEGFSHAEAAATLEVALMVLTERLVAARRILGGTLGHDAAAQPGHWPIPPHLRLIK